MIQFNLALQCNHQHTRKKKNTKNLNNLTNQESSAVEHMHSHMRHRTTARGSTCTLDQPPSVRLHHNLSLFTVSFLVSILSRKPDPLSRKREGFGELCIQAVSNSPYPSLFLRKCVWPWSGLRDYSRSWVVW